jgi:hypothetical protein
MSLNAWFTRPPKLVFKPSAYLSTRSWLIQAR